jgi:hypothetical protein
MSGYDNGSFRPNAEITRAEMAVVIANALYKPISANAATDFADNEEIPFWAKSSVVALQRAGIMQGKARTLGNSHRKIGLQEPRL